MILGEGAAMLVLEPLEAARARGARIHAEIVGFGMSADACHITQPSAEGAARAMRAALRDAALGPEQIGYINAHGTGTAANDSTETAAIRAYSARMPTGWPSAPPSRCTATRWARPAALECLAAVAGPARRHAAAHRQLPRARPGVRPGRHSQPARAAQVEYALSNSFAFGGLNAVLAFRRI